MEPSARHLALHGAIVLLIGLACGGPYGRAINRSAPAHIVQSWRVAHASLPMAGILMLAVAALLSHFTVEGYVKWLIALALIASSYAFCVSLPWLRWWGIEAYLAKAHWLQSLFMGATLLELGYPPWQRLPSYTPHSSPYEPPG